MKAQLVLIIMAFAIASCTKTFLGDAASELIDSTTAEVTQNSDGKQRSVFNIDQMDDLHKKMATTIMEMKKDGIKIILNVVFYNLVLNLERECLLFFSNVDICDQFRVHMHKVLENVYTDSNIENLQKFPTIEDFYNQIIFDDTEANSKVVVAEDFKRGLSQLKNHFNSDAFATMKQKIITMYTNSFEELSHYLNTGKPIEEEQVNDQESV